MKKRIIILVIILLLTTGCTCEYNLTIENSTYKEEIIIGAENNKELTTFYKDWIIEVDKDDYNIVKEEMTKDSSKNYYNYEIKNSNLVFNYNFTRNGLMDSTAVSKCYNTLSVSYNTGNIIVSTSKEAKCYENYPTLSNLKVNIKTSLKSISNNADEINGNTYTWNITKENAKNKSINLILDNSLPDENSNSSGNGTNINLGEEKEDYTLYIFLLILLVCMLSAYFAFNYFKNKNNINEDD